MGVDFSGIHADMKSNRFCSDFGFGQLGFAYALGQAGAAVGGGVPLVHAVEQLVALMDDVDVRLRQYVQIGIGMIMATSMMRSCSGLRPVISISSQQRLFAFWVISDGLVFSVGSIIKDKGSGRLKAFVTSCAIS